jgi:pSer/pThr/pTyr-binding forkhead associated (FHA) protein
MSLRDDVPMLIDKWKEHKDQLEHNEELFNIFEGDLQTYLLKDLSKQLSQKSYDEVSKRIAPINILKRLIDKLSKIYEKAPVRTFPDGKASQADVELLSEYEKILDINNVMGATDGANGFFNLFKNVWIEPFVEKGEPKLRILPSDRFFVVSTDRVNNVNPTHLVKIMGKYKNAQKVDKILFYAYTDNEFLIYDEDKTILDSMMREVENPEGVNPFGALPGVYINRSKYSVMPKPDSDTLAMTKLIPVALSDLNYAMMYQCFSILYTIDCDQTGLTMAPNSLWNIKSDGASDKEPKIGMIKPDVDSEKALSLIQALFTLWMETRNIKAGSMGQISAQHLSSGIAKIIDEMDTSGDRKAQVSYFEKAERDLWEFIIDKAHPVWRQDQEFELKQDFTPGMDIEITFSEQTPNVDTSKAIADQQLKLKMGIQSKRGALEELYPDWSEDQINAKLQEIADEKIAATVNPVTGSEVTLPDGADKSKQDVTKGPDITDPNAVTEVVTGPGVTKPIVSPL